MNEKLRSLRRKNRPRARWKLSSLSLRNAMVQRKNLQFRCPVLPRCGPYQLPSIWLPRCGPYQLPSIWLSRSTLVNRCLRRTLTQIYVMPTPSVIGTHNFTSHMSLSIIVTGDTEKS
ncbi:hypothetical protein ACROYT_G001676 [Oculina patagonica]